MEVQQPERFLYSAAALRPRDPTVLGRQTVNPQSSTLRMTDSGEEHAAVIIESVHRAVCSNIFKRAHGCGKEVHLGIVPRDRIEYIEELSHVCMRGAHRTCGVRVLVDSSEVLGLPYNQREGGDLDLQDASPIH